MARQEGRRLYCARKIAGGLCVYLCSTNKGLASIAVTFGTDDDPLYFFRQRFPQDIISKDIRVNEEPAAAVESLLKGHRLDRLPPLDIELTPFQQKVMEAIRQIPYGETRTYGEVARGIGNPRAARAVGGALSSNPLPIIFPCHRVVGVSDLGGYTEGLQVKAYILDLERRSARSL